MTRTRPPLALDPRAGTVRCAACGHPRIRHTAGEWGPGCAHYDVPSLADQAAGAPPVRRCTCAGYTPPKGN